MCVVTGPPKDISLHNIEKSSLHIKPHQDDSITRKKDIFVQSIE